MVAELLAFVICLNQAESELGCMGQLLLGNCCKVHIIWAVCKPDGACPGPQPGQGEVVTDATPSMHLQHVDALKHGPRVWAGRPTAIALQRMICMSLRQLSSCNQPGTDVLPCHLSSLPSEAGSKLLPAVPHSPPAPKPPTCTAWSMTFKTTLGAMTLAAAIWPRAARLPTLSSAWAAFSTVRRAALSSMRARAKSALQQTADRSRLRGWAAGHSKGGVGYTCPSMPLQGLPCNKGGDVSAAGRAQTQVRQSRLWQSLPCSTLGI